METVSKILSENIRKLRVSLNLTQAELAEKAEISFRGIQQIEYGQSKHPRSDTVRKIARALGVEESVLFKDPASPTAPEKKTLANMTEKDLTEIIARASRDIAEASRSTARPSPDDLKRSKIKDVIDKLDPRYLDIVLSVVTGVHAGKAFKRDGFFKTKAG